jgi:uncharacterized protein (DUF58 family)
VDHPQRRSIALGSGLFFLLLGALVSNVALAAWGIAVSTMSVAAMLWVRVGWREVDVSVRFYPERVFISERTEVRIHIRNAKRLPVPLMRLGVWLPVGLSPVEEHGPGTIRGFRRRLYLPGNSEASLALPIQASRRGEYRLRLIEAELSDPFGLTPLHREITPPVDLLVMPEPRIEIPVEVRRRLPFGSPAPLAFMFEQPERFAGVRPYEAGDPLNRIHWKLTGHSGVLQTKLFEPTRTADTVLVLDLATGEPFWDSVYPDIAEDTIGWASFVARQAVASGWRIGLVANAHLSRGRGPIRVLPSSAHGHEAALFAALARMPNEPTSDLAPLLREVGRGLSRTAVVVVISPRPGPWLREEIEVVRRRGLEVVELSPVEARLADSAR